MTDTLPPGWIFIGFNWNIDAFSTSRLAAVFGGARNENVPGTTLLLNSLGGSPEHALYLSNLIRGFPTPIYTHNISTVQSAANLVFLAGQKRFAEPEATFMFHETVFNVQSVSLTPAQLSLQVSGIRNSDKITLGRLTEVSDQPESVFKNILTGDRLYPATEAQRLGIVNAVRPIHMPPDSRFIQVTLDQPKA